MLSTNINWALCVAARSRHTDCVRALVGLGAAVDARTYYGETPLALAAVGGYIDVVHELVSSGGDLHAQDRDGQKQRTRHVTEISTG